MVQLYKQSHCRTAVHMREKCSICTITSVYFLPLSPRYEAIHHKALDGEEIILYIEDQCCHLEGKAQFNHLPIFALNKGQCYFYHSVAVGGKEGDRNSQRDSPPHCGDIPPQGPPEGERPNYTEVTQIARLERGVEGGGGSYGVHGDYISYQCFFLFFFVKFSWAGRVYSSCWLWYMSNVTIAILFHLIATFSAQSHCVALWLRHMPGTGDICHVANNVSRIFSRSWWYHDVAVSMRAPQRERD